MSYVESTARDAYRTVVPDLDSDPNVGSYFVLSGIITIGDDSFNVRQFPLSFRLFTIINADGLIRHNDRATLVLGADISRLTPLAIGPNVIANIFIAMETTGDQLFADTSLSSLVGLTLDDLCFRNELSCSAHVGSRFGLQMFQPGLTGIFQISGDLEYLSVNVVPIPTAAWLFGSSLGLLGWMRRRTA